MYRELFEQATYSKRHRKRLQITAAELKIRLHSAMVSISIFANTASAFDS